MESHKIILSNDTNHNKAKQYMIPTIVSTGVTMTQALKKLFTTKKASKFFTNSKSTHPIGRAISYTAAAANMVVTVLSKTPEHFSYFNVTSQEAASRVHYSQKIRSIANGFRILTYFYNIVSSATIFCTVLEFNDKLSHNIFDAEIHDALWKEILSCSIATYLATTNLISVHCHTDKKIEKNIQRLFNAIQQPVYHFDRQVIKTLFVAGIGVAGRTLLAYNSVNHLMIKLNGFSCLSSYLKHTMINGFVVSNLSSVILNKLPSIYDIISKKESNLDHYKKKITSIQYSPKIQRGVIYLACMLDAISLGVGHSVSISRVTDKLNCISNRSLAIFFAASVGLSSTLSESFVVRCIFGKTNSIPAEVSHIGLFSSSDPEKVVRVNSNVCRRKNSTSINTSTEISVKNLRNQSVFKQNQQNDTQQKDEVTSHICIIS